MLIPFDQLFQRYIKLPPPGALHLGANTGQEANTYFRLGIRSVIWVEAIPELFSQLRKNIQNYPGNVALQACVSDVDGKEVAFHVANNGGQSSSFLELGTHSKEHPSVKFVRDIKLTTSRVDSLLKDHGLEIGKGWFLNMDLQGAELLAMKGMGTLIKKFAYVYVEVNEKHLYKGCPLVGEIDAFLAPFGFKGVETKMTGSGWGDKFYVRR
jgi:FkbM family methyltransferase